MEKIVSITRQAAQPEGSSPLRIMANSGVQRWAAESAGVERTRGILLHFPRPYQGPLPAA
jgi:hypothetical protein